MTKLITLRFFVVRSLTYVETSNCPQPDQQKSKSYKYLRSKTMQLYIAFNYNFGRPQTMTMRIQYSFKGLWLWRLYIYNFIKTNFQYNIIEIIFFHVGVIQTIIDMTSDPYKSTSSILNLSFTPYLITNIKKRFLLKVSFLNNRIKLTL